MVSTGGGKMFGIVNTTECIIPSCRGKKCAWLEVGDKSPVPVVCPSGYCLFLPWKREGEIRFYCGFLRPKVMNMRVFHYCPFDGASRGQGSHDYSGDDFFE